MPDSIKTARIAFVVAAGLAFATAALLLFIFFSGAALIGWGTERSSLLGSALLGAAGSSWPLALPSLGSPASSSPLASPKACLGPGSPASSSPSCC